LGLANARNNIAANIPKEATMTKSSIRVKALTKLFSQRFIGNCRSSIKGASTF
jgi:hypothetical protein